MQANYRNALWSKDPYLWSEFKELLRNNWIRYQEDNWNHNKYNPKKNKDNIPWRWDQQSNHLERKKKKKEPWDQLSDHNIEADQIIQYSIESSKRRDTQLHIHQYEP